MPVTRCEHHGLPALMLRSGDGARAMIALHGGHVVSWMAAGSGVEQLYLSPASAYVDGTPIRGGVPVVFPQFSDRGPLMNHGFARIRPWVLLRAEDGADGTATAVLRLVDDAHSRSAWPHAFALDLYVRVHAGVLAMELACTNTGSGPLQFSCALHTYLRVDDVAGARVHGLQSRDFWDKVDGRDKVQPDEWLSVDGELDRVYPGVASDLTVHRGGGAEPGALRVSQRGFEDVVVWNPGLDRCAMLADMPADGYRKMLCVEAARITHPLALQAGQQWSGAQQLELVI